MAKTYELIVRVAHPRATGGYVFGERVAADNARTAAHTAVKMIRAAQGGVRRVDVVSPGAPVDVLPFMTCAYGARSEAARAREAKIARERRGYHNVITCEVFSKPFKRELAKKAPKRRRRAKR